MYDNTDNVRDVTAGLRKGDEVEIVYRGTVSCVSDGDVALSDDERWCFAPHEVRVIKRARAACRYAGLVPG